MMEINKDNEQNEVDENKEKKQESADIQPQRNWGPQILGAMVGAFIFLIAGGVANQLGWITGSTARWWLWGAVIGGLVGSSEALNNSGKILTKSDNKWLNIAVSLLGMAVFFGLVYALSGLVGWIISLFKI